MKAIVVKYHGPTNTRGSRFVASAEGVKSVSVSYDHSLSADENATCAAQALAHKNDWAGEYVSGSLPDGRRVFVDGRSKEFTVKRPTRPTHVARPSEMNDEGLTYVEWMAAAGEPAEDCFAAWSAGEDPTEYRAVAK